MSVVPHRLSEASALLPLLHVAPGKTVIWVMGPLAPVMAAEVLRWRDTAEVLTMAPLLGINDRRVRLVAAVEPASCDLILLSPEQAPTATSIRCLKPGGVIQAMATDIEHARLLLLSLRSLVGNATPWREYLPAPLWGVIACVGSPCKRKRQPPNSVKRLSAQYLPCVFTFGKDELPLVFPTKTDKIALPSA